MSVEGDGYVCPARDPPGQQCVYIMPGDPRREVYRLYTFMEYPGSAKQNPWELVKAGFYYTGYKDRVRCGRCGKQVADWQADENPRDAKWHEVWCQFDCKNREHNIPVSEVRLMGQRGLERGIESRATQTTLASPQAHVVPPVRQLVTRTTDVNPSATLRNSTGAARNASHAATLREMFPCENPINPHMATHEQRLSTFRDHAVPWARNNIRATMQDMAEAGLYYLGIRDKVKCWYCNGGLQNWALNDNPWFEHAKWIPTCEFVLRNKGPEFIEGVTSRFPGLGRDNEFTRSRRLREAFTMPKPVIIDPRQQELELRQRAHVEVETSLIAQEALKMGFDKEHVTNAVAKQLKHHDRGFGQVETLVNALLEETVDKSEMLSSDDETEPLKKDDPLKRLKALEDSMNCQECRTKKAIVLLLPCGHLNICESCMEHVSRCPTCGETIREKIRTFRV